MGIVQRAGRGGARRRNAMRCDAMRRQADDGRTELLKLRSIAMDRTGRQAGSSRSGSRKRAGRARQAAAEIAIPASSWKARGRGDTGERGAIPGPKQPFSPGRKGNKKTNPRLG